MTGLYYSKADGGNTGDFGRSVDAEINLQNVIAVENIGRANHITAYGLEQREIRRVYLNDGQKPVLVYAVAGGSDSTPDAIRELEKMGGKNTQTFVHTQTPATTDREELNGHFTRPITVSMEAGDVTRTTGLTTLPINTPIVSGAFNDGTDVRADGRGLTISGTTLAIGGETVHVSHLNADRLLAVPDQQTATALKQEGALQKEEQQKAADLAARKAAEEIAAAERAATLKAAEQSQAVEAARLAARDRRRMQELNEWHANMLAQGAAEDRLAEQQAEQRRTRNRAAATTLNTLRERAGLPAPAEGADALSHNIDVLARASYRSGSPFEMQMVDANGAPLTVSFASDTGQGGQLRVAGPDGLFLATMAQGRTLTTKDQTLDKLIGATPAQAVPTTAGRKVTGQAFRL